MALTVGYGFLRIRRTSITSKQSITKLLANEYLMT